MSIYSRVKGAAGERELAKKLIEVFGCEARRGQQFRARLIRPTLLPRLTAFISNASGSRGSKFIRLWNRRRETRVRRFRSFDIGGIGENGLRWFGSRICRSWLGDLLDDFGRRIFLNIFFWVGAMVIDLRYVVSAIRLLRRGKERLLDVVFWASDCVYFFKYYPLAVEVRQTVTSLSWVYHHRAVAVFFNENGTRRLD